VLFHQPMPSRPGFETSRLLVLHYLWSLCKIRRMLASDSPSDTEWWRTEWCGLLSLASLTTAIFWGVCAVLTLPPSLMWNQ
jgi:hypothetical protein